MGKGAEVAILEQCKKYHFRLKVGPTEDEQEEEVMVKSTMMESEHQHFLA